MDDPSTKISAAAGTRLSRLAIGMRSAQPKQPRARIEKRSDSISDTLEMTDSDLHGNFVNKRDEAEQPEAGQGKGSDDSLSTGDVLDITG